MRIEKEVDGDKVRYYYEGSLLLCEKDGAGKMQKVYINDGEGIIGMVRYIYNKNGIFSHHQWLYYLYDSLGSVSVITGENGLPLQNYTYSPYGSTMNVKYDRINGLRFVGRYGGYKDDDTNLIYFWHRWYDEGDGRWVSRDVFGTYTGKNYYEYSFNNSLIYIDYAGLCPGGTPIPVYLPRPNLPSNWWEETWMKIPIWHKWIPGYGNYCGPSWSGGKWKTVEQEITFNAGIKDAIDNCCREHDICAYKVRSGQDKCIKMSDCDKQLRDCFKIYLLYNFYAAGGWAIFTILTFGE